jgi:hypothetical protein
MGITIRRTTNSDCHSRHELCSHALPAINPRRRTKETQNQAWGRAGSSERLLVREWTAEGAWRRRQECRVVVAVELSGRRCRVLRPVKSKLEENPNRRS